MVVLQACDETSSLELSRSLTPLSISREEEEEEERREHGLDLVTGS